MNADTYTKTGSKATTAIKLDKAIFGVEIANHDLLKSAYTGHLANQRIASATTKTRGLVSGGGKKPWKQKGTGRARFGSIRNPIWRGGGIVFGPDGTENFTVKLHTKAKRQAIRQALTLAQNAKSVKVIEALDDKKISTSALAALLTKVGATRNILLVVPQKTEAIVKSSRNLADVTLVKSTYLSAFEILNADTVVFTKDALSAMNEWLGNEVKNG